MATDSILESIRQKRDALLAEANVYNKVLEEFTSPSTPSLREMVIKVLQDNPLHRMDRGDIIKEVKRRIPSARHIGVVSALNNKELFKQIGKDTFELRVS